MMRSYEQKSASIKKIKQATLFQPTELPINKKVELKIPLDHGWQHGCVQKLKLAKKQFENTNNIDGLKKACDYVQLYINKNSGKFNTKAKTWKRILAKYQHYYLISLMKNLHLAQFTYNRSRNKAINIEQWRNAYLLAEKYFNEINQNIKHAEEPHSIKDFSGKEISSDIETWQFFLKASHNALALIDEQGVEIKDEIRSPKIIIDSLVEAKDEAKPSETLIDSPKSLTITLLAPLLDKEDTNKVEIIETAEYKPNLMPIKDMPYESKTIIPIHTEESNVNIQKVQKTTHSESGCCINWFPCFWKSSPPEPTPTPSAPSHQKMI